MAVYTIIERKYFLAEKIDATPEVEVVRFRPEDNQPWSFDPGMFFMISGIDKDGKKYLAKAFSVASDPAAVNLEFFIVKEPLHPKVGATPAAGAAPPMEPGPSHFMEANTDDVFMMKGPSGQFRFDPAKDKKVLFVAGGTGLAPFMSMLRHLKATGAKTDVKVLYSVKYPTEIILKDELYRLVKDIGAQITVTVTRPQPGDGWTGPTGHIDDPMINSCIIDEKERMCYICGPLAFVKGMKDALAKCGVAPDRISADVWG